MIIEINYIGGSEEWWVEIGASQSTIVADIGKVELKFTYGKITILNNVLHTPKMRENLVSGFLLNKARFTLTIASDLYKITKNNIFVLEKVCY